LEGENVESVVFADFPQGKRAQVENVAILAERCQGAAHAVIDSDEHFHFRRG
jgi:hypothetical protein